MFQPVFSVFIFVYLVLNCHSNSVNTLPKTMFMLL